MQYRHLRQHTVACFMNDDAARPIEYRLADDDAAPHRQAMHEAAIVFCDIEPRFVDAPVNELVPQLLIRQRWRTRP